MKDTATPEALAMTEEIRTTVNAAIESLPEDLRTAIVLRELEGLSLRGNRRDDGLPGRAPCGRASSVPARRSTRG